MELGKTVKNRVGRLINSLHNLVYSDVHLDIGFILRAKIFRLLQKSVDLSVKDTIKISVINEINKHTYYEDR
jgi:hypothetical protein